MHAVQEPRGCLASIVSMNAAFKPRAVRGWAVLNRTRTFFTARIHGRGSRAAA
jgi:hypothetical protein